MNVEEKEDEYFINKRAIGELFDSKFDLNVNLWRGRNPHNSDLILYPILKAFKMSNGNLRPEDIKTYRKNGELWVKAKSGGISLFDRSGIPSKNWEYYKLLGIGVLYLTLASCRFSLPQTQLHRTTLWPGRYA